MPEVLKEASKKVPYTEQIKKAKKMVKKNQRKTYREINAQRM